jgi:hypothetical protein
MFHACLWKQKAGGDPGRARNEIGFLWMGARSARLGNRDKAVLLLVGDNLERKKPLSPEEDPHGPMAHLSFSSCPY